MPDLIKGGRRKKETRMMSIRVLSQSSPGRVHFPVPACTSACMCIWFVSRNTSSGTLRCKSAQEGKCVYTSTDACSPRCFQAPWMTFFSSQWEILGGAKQPQSYKPKGQNETRCDKLLNSCHSVLHPFCLSLSLSFASALLWRKKKKSLQLPSFYNLGESLTTAISHDKVFN